MEILTRNPDHRVKNRPFFIRFSVLLICFSLMSAFSSASGAAPSTESSSVDRIDSIRLAQTALRNLREAYTSKSADAFFKLVEDDAYFSAVDLRTRLSADFARQSQADLYIFIDFSIVKEGKTVLKTHWQKRVMASKTGAPVKSEGKANFVFRIREGSAMLLNIEGQSPF